MSKPRVLTRPPTHELFTATNSSDWMEEGTDNDKDGRHSSFTTGLTPTFGGVRPRLIAVISSERIAKTITQAPSKIPSFINLDQQEVPEMATEAAASSTSSMAQPLNGKKPINLPPGFPRAVALFGVLFFAVVLCSVTVSAAPSASAPPPQQPVQQLPAPPISNQLDALRNRVAQLQNAVMELQLQQHNGAAAQPEQAWPINTRPFAKRQMAWQPMKRMVQNQETNIPDPFKIPSTKQVSWQPVKRNQPAFAPNNGANLQMGEGGGNLLEASLSPKEQVMMTVEQQLVEVLQAGERLGVSADEILTHLRARNGFMRM